MAARFPRFHVGVTPFKGRKCAEKVFQSAHPRGVRPWTAIRSPSTNPGFNPRTREGCDQRRPAGEYLHQCFNPRTREGCDRGRRLAGIGLRGFQSTHPRGVRPPPPCKGGVLPLFQSTHPRGVRPSRRSPGTLAPQRFNPRTREGCDAAAINQANYEHQFQSTHPRGVRR